MRRRRPLTRMLGAALVLTAAGCGPASPAAGPLLRPAAGASPLSPSHRGNPQLRDMLGWGVAEQFPLDHVEEETTRFPEGSAAIAAADDFVFVLGQGSAWHGFDTLKVEGSGRAEIMARGATGGSFRHVVFQLSREEVAALRRELAAIDVFGMKRGYFARVDDGTQWFVRVRAGGQRKTVLLDNHFPAPIVRVAEHVRTRLLPPHRAEIDAAEVLTAPGSYREPMRWPEREAERPDRR